MARKKVTITDLKKLCTEKDQQGMVCVSIGRDGTTTVTTYGENKIKCASLGWWAKGLVNELSIIPFRTIFGWGNSGIAQPLTTEEKKTHEKTLKEYDIPEEFQ